MADITLSVALVTRNRPESLERCLASWRSQDVQPFEIVVSDDSDDHLQGKIQQIAERFQARWIAGPRRGLYANRNRAFVECRGTHIMSADDDHTHPEGFVRMLIEAIESDPESIWTTGEISYVGSVFYDKAETASQLTPSGVGGPVSSLNDNWSIADGSTIYPSKVFRRGYRMVDHFAYGQSYLEFGAFLYARGFSSRCARNAQIFHWSSQATLDRAKSSDNTATVLFACLCYNLHFKRNIIFAVYYGAKLLMWRFWDYRLVRELPGLFSLAHKRWSQF